LEKIIHKYSSGKTSPPKAASPKKKSPTEYRKLQHECAKLKKERKLPKDVNCKGKKEELERRIASAKSPKKKSIPQVKSIKRGMSLKEVLALPRTTTKYSKLIVGEDYIHDERKLEQLARVLLALVNDIYNNVEKYSKKSSSEMRVEFKNEKSHNVVDFVNLHDNKIIIRFKVGLQFGGEEFLYIYSGTPMKLIYDKGYDYHKVPTSHLINKWLKAHS
jgi:hypothetical protein